MNISIHTWHKHINLIRWLIMSFVFICLLLIPFLYLYQIYQNQNFDQLNQNQKTVYGAMETITSPFTNNPNRDLNQLKGNTWSGVFFGLSLSDPLALLALSSSKKQVYWPLVMTAIIPLLVTISLGRIFCGWICPANFIYELNSKLRRLLGKTGLKTGNKRYKPEFKYLILLSGTILCLLTGTATVFAIIYPPLLIGQELFFLIALGGFGSGILFFAATLLLDLLVAKRCYCRYLCPGGALYSLLGKYRLLRIQRNVNKCDDCGHCISACEFGLNPMHDRFGQECNNCTACIHACKPEALGFSISVKDQKNQGAGHLGKAWLKHNASQGQTSNE